MLNKEDNIRLLQRRTAEYRSVGNDIGGVVDDFDEMGKLGRGFTSINQLEEVDIGNGSDKRPTYISTKLSAGWRKEVCELLRVFIGCFAWDYSEMPGLG
jgi:hypothetical protein